VHTVSPRASERAGPLRSLARDSGWCALRPHAMMLHPIKHSTPTRRANEGLEPQRFLACGPGSCGQRWSPVAPHPIEPHSSGSARPCSCAGRASPGVYSRAPPNGVAWRHGLVALAFRLQKLERNGVTWRHGLAWLGLTEKGQLLAQAGPCSRRARVGVPVRGIPVDRDLPVDATAIDGDDQGVKWYETDYLQSGRRYVRTIRRGPITARVQSLAPWVEW
jgi:hypothetical protein